MSRARLLLVHLFCFGLATLVQAQVLDPTSCPDDAAQFRIARITKRLPDSIQTPLKSGDLLSAQQLTTVKNQITKHVNEERVGAYRFRYQAVTVSCENVDQAKRTVDVELRADDVVIPEGASAGTVIDEANADRLEVLRDLSSVEFKWNRDARLGEVLGGALQARSSKEGRPFNLLIDGWKSADEPFHSVSMSSQVTRFLQARGLHTVGDFRLWTQDVPFADGSASSKGLRLGFGWELQSGRADLRVTTAYRLSRVGFDGPVESMETQFRNSIELGAVQEFLTHGGFVRVGGSLDSGGGSRVGGFTRWYQDIRIPRFPSWSADATFMVGRSLNSLEPDRRFVGGNRLDPFLGDRNPGQGEFTWAGPILRGHGVSDFYVPRQLYANDDGAAFRGISLTLGLPGWRRPVIEAIDVKQREVVTKEVQKAYATAVVSLVQKNVRLGPSGLEARRRSEREAHELRAALHNVMRHAHRLIVSPLVTIDAGWLRDHGFARDAVDVGAGLRVQRRGLSVEILRTTNVHDTLDAYPRSDRWLLRASLGATFQFPNPLQ